MNVSYRPLPIFIGMKLPFEHVGVSFEFIVVYSSEFVREALKENPQKQSSHIPEQHEYPATKYPRIHLIPYSSNTRFYFLGEFGRNFHINALEKGTYFIEI